MKNKLNWKLIQNPNLILFCHVIIFALLLLNFRQQFLINNKERQNQILEMEIIQIKANIEDLQKGESFQNSDFFEEKEIKNQGYKKTGEVVIDTSIIEPVLVNSEDKRNYIPN